ncbi:MAG TPA: efflux RND transporter periplasmic adaptor subunit [Terriglobales bacterium]|nr:efflux RND transporter periplasmic adaptor subunit [Terriglobales bacterium]
MTGLPGTPESSTQNSGVSRANRVGRKSGLWLPLILITCAFFWSCGGSDPKPNAARANVVQAVPVSVSTAERRDMPYYLTGLGAAQAFYTDSLKTRVDGELMQVNFKEGQYVNKGDLLVVIDPRPYQVALEQAQATLYKDQASLRDAKLNLERYKGLLQNSGAMSQQQVDTQATTVDTLEGAVRTDQAAVDNAKLNLTYCHITSPISGRVGLRLVDPGNIVHASDTNALLVITQLQPIAVLFTLPEDQLPSVSQHMAKNTLEVDAYSRDDQTKLASGKLLTIDNQIDQTTGTGRLKAVFDNKENTLWPNQFVNVHLLLEIRKNSTVIPAAAIQRGPQGTYVFVAKPDHTADIRPVTIAFTQENMANISSGIAPGDVVITDGQDKLQQGSQIQIRTPSAPSNQPQTAAQPSGSPTQSGQRPVSGSPTR